MIAVATSAGASPPFSLAAAPPAVNGKISPLRYPGGKGHMAALIMSHFPAGLEVLVSPFFGGGGLEFAAAAQGVRVHGYDAFAPLVNFWRFALGDAAGVANLAEEHYPLGREDFKSLRDGYDGLEEGAVKAAAFYALNRASFGGTTWQGIGFYKDGTTAFRPLSLMKLREFRADNVSVSCADFRESIRAHPGEFIYADPPYPVRHEKLYGRNGELHRNFPHDELAALLLARDGWALSYNDCELVRDLYAGCRFVKMSWDYQFARHAGRQGRELLILPTHD